MPLRSDLEQAAITPPLDVVLDLCAAAKGKVEAPGPHAGRFGELRAAAAAAGRLGLQQARVGAVESGRRLGGDGKCGRRGGPEPKGLHEEKHLG